MNDGILNKEDSDDKRNESQPANDRVLKHNSPSGDIAELFVDVAKSLLVLFFFKLFDLVFEEDWKRDNLKDADEQAKTTSPEAWVDDSMTFKTFLDVDRCHDENEVKYSIQNR